MRRVALFGGSFNPPHVAHQMACLWVLETAEIDELWVIPTYRHAFDKALAPFEHRVRMCELATEIFGDRVRVSRIEEAIADDGAARNRTLDTLHALQERFPDHAWRLVVGADILAETDKWHRWDAISELAPPLVVGRTGHAGPAAVAPVDMPAVSSTAVRAALARGEDATGLVSRAVMNYIARLGIYR